MAYAGTNVAVLMMTLTCLFSSALASGKWFDRVYIAMFENADFSTASADPNFAKWAAQGKLLTNYDAVAHPSQPNYISIIAGSPFGVINDNTINLAEKNLVDLLESAAHPISWKAYMENYTGNCNAAATIGLQFCPHTWNIFPSILYARKHNPFISFDDIRNDAERCAMIVPAMQLTTDTSNNAVPQFNFYVPNQCNDGHDTNVQYAGKFLDNFMTNTFTGNAVSGRTLVILTFDENDGTSGNQVFTTLIPFGDMEIDVGSTDDTQFNHYSLLRTIEDNWSLGNLGENDAAAIPFNFP